MKTINSFFLLQMLHYYNDFTNGIYKSLKLKFTMSIETNLQGYLLNFSLHQRFLRILDDR